MSKAEQAVDCFNNGFSCSQAIFSTYAVDFGIDRGIALKIASSFGAGMAGMGKTCGAVTGAFMLLGLKYGRMLPDDEEAKKTNYARVEEFVKIFLQAYGTLACSELLGFDISTPEGYRQAKAEELFSTRCPEIVRLAAEIVEDLIDPGCNK
ncbi:MAG: C_GCAxxG_C_C family protein [Candidatus Krumholzibacteriota bacterium]|nr:C_GCAxxG_C_C family protein [Candidatus Krumholzibacteriota bacterium]